MQVGPLIPPKQGPLIPPSTKPKSQTRKQNSSSKKKQTVRPKCTGSRKTCRRRELRRRAAEKRRRQEKAKQQIASSATSQSVEEASVENGSYLSTDSGYNEYKEYMAQKKLKDEELGELYDEIEQLEQAGNHEEAAKKRKTLQIIIEKTSAMNRQFETHNEPIMPLSTS